MSKAKILLNILEDDKETMELFDVRVVTYNRDFYYMRVPSVGRYGRVEVRVGEFKVMKKGNICRLFTLSKGSSYLDNPVNKAEDGIPLAVGITDTVSWHLYVGRYLTQGPSVFSIFGPASKEDAQELLDKLVLTNQELFAFIAPVKETQITNLICTNYNV